MSEEKKRKPIKLIDDPSELPTDLSDEEQLEFWETHGLSQEFLDKTEEVPADERPRPREKTTPISVRFDAHTLDRLKAMADRRSTGYQTLLKQFVVERLYEEEKLEGRGSVGTADNAEARYLEAWERIAPPGQEWRALYEALEKIAHNVGRHSALRSQPPEDQN
jgi:hypothetical protein